MHITVTRDDGSTVDITTGVQVAYDVAYSSMDWGSGFLDIEEMGAIADLAEACQFPSYAEALEAVQATRRAEDARIARAALHERTERERRADEERARAQLAAEMREAEPALVRAGWTDAELLTLHAFRKSGRA